VEAAKPLAAARGRGGRHPPWRAIWHACFDARGEANALMQLVPQVWYTCVCILECPTGPSSLHSEARWAHTCRRTAFLSPFCPCTLQRHQPLAASSLWQQYAGGGSSTSTSETAVSSKASTPDGHLRVAEPFAVPVGSSPLLVFGPTSCNSLPSSHNRHGLLQGEASEVLAASAAWRGGSGPHCCCRPRSTSQHMPSSLHSKHILVLNTGDI